MKDAEELKNKGDTGQTSRWSLIQHITVRFTALKINQKAANKTLNAD